MARLRAAAPVLALAGTALALPAVQGVPLLLAEAGELDARVARIERLLGSQGMLDLANQIERLQQEIKRFRGEIEQQSHSLEQMDKRLQQLEATRTGAPARLGMAPGDPSQRAPAHQTTTATATPPLAGPPAPNPAPTPGTGPTATEAPAGGQAPPELALATPATEQEAYQQAFALLKAGRYDQSITGFQGFLSQYPNSSSADSAQYWLGEAYYVTHQFEPAIAEYNKLVQNHPQSQRLGQALLKIGYSYHELGQIDQAKASLEDLKKRYPGTTAARLAEERLQRIKLEQQ